MNLTSGIRSAASALGIDPIDLATVISYETGGTLDPMQAGPTTKWGRHRGFIQFGEPQAERYGVDFSSPDAALSTQLGEGGAVVAYLRDAGVRPGMGIMDIYSAINTGYTGRYNWSDEGAGGAPGTVRDKVTNQMQGHRERAYKLFSDTTPGPDDGSRPLNESISAAYNETSVQPAQTQNAYLSALSPQPRPDDLTATSLAPENSPRAEPRKTQVVELELPERSPPKRQDIAALAQDFFSSLTPQQVMVERAAHARARQQGAPTSLADWFAQVRFPTYVRSFMSGQEDAYLGTLTDMQRKLLKSALST